MTWHIAETRLQVEWLFGREQVVLARPSMKSVVDRQEERDEVRFAAFRYADEVYPETAVTELLEPEYARSSRVTIDAGEKLNHVLQALSPSFP